MSRPGHGFFQIVKLSFCYRLTNFAKDQLTPLTLVSLLFFLLKFMSGNKITFLSLAPMRTPVCFPALLPCVCVRIIFKANASDLKMFPITKGDGREWERRERRERERFFRCRDGRDGGGHYRTFEAGFNG